MGERPRASLGPALSHGFRTAFSQRTPAIVNVGRPKQHDDETRATLLAATERVVSEFGVGAFSVRTALRARP